jgi:hypothetical protein
LDIKGETRVRNQWRTNKGEFLTRNLLCGIDGRKNDVNDADASSKPFAGLAGVIFCGPIYASMAYGSPVRLQAVKPK